MSPEILLFVFCIIVGYAWGRADAADLGPWRKPWARRGRDLDSGTVVQLHVAAERRRKS